MVPAIRTAFNAAFTSEKYEAFLHDLNAKHPGDIEFRIAETPIYVDKAFTQKVMAACESIVDVIVRPDFLELTKDAIPANVRVPNETPYSDFIAFDFGICQNKSGELEPQLIEMQGFPTLFAYQIWDAEVSDTHFGKPTGYDSYLNGYTPETYAALLKRIILGSCKPEEVVLLEIYPDAQKTRIDFKCTKDYVGIETVCLTQLKADGLKLYYTKDGKRQNIERIYNRLIFDDLHKQVLPEGTIDITQPWQVQWCPHPNWFYRISKYTLPFINSPYVPKTQFVHLLESVPADLENYVLKPLFSFAGQGVIIDVKPEDITALTDPENWILQQKVQYAAAVQTPDEPAKAEIRIFYFWEKGAARPVGAQNLARLSKGKMIGVRYNADKTWVGGSLVYFEQ
ncbi:MAG: hypothetical protein EAY75_06645 [Bacteroidetes bacterium]|nr:MAG: hypothetical protein EAY75_06645 [Bacteroidota bacterium]